LLAYYYLVIGAIGILIFLNIPFLSYADDDWKIQNVTREDGHTFKIPYKIINGTIEKITYQSGGIMVYLNSTNNIRGLLEISIPRDLFNPQDVQGRDMPFITLVNGQFGNFKEVVDLKCLRTLDINLNQDTKEIALATTITSGPIPRSVVPPIYITISGNSSGSQQNIMVSGCTDLGLNDKELTVTIINNQGQIYKTVSIIPDANGLFSSSVLVQGNPSIQGNYTVNATYAGYTTATTLSVPEFPSFWLIILVASISLLLILQLVLKQTLIMQKF